MPSAAVVERRTRAVELVAEGLSYDDIAKELGYANRSGAWKAVQASLKAVQAETVDEYRALTIDRYEALLTQVWPAAMDGDLKAVASARRIVDAECRLLGLV
jgi:orotate phosphoribosyltransferase-like protein